MPQRLLQPVDPLFGRRETLRGLAFLLQGLTLELSPCAPVTPPATVPLPVGPPPIVHAAPAQPLTRSSCWGRSCPGGQNALAARAQDHVNKMKHNPNALPAEGQPNGPSPRLLSPLLPGLGMRPTYFFSWPFAWGCSMGKAPIGGPFCDPSSRMGAAPHSGTPAVSQSDTEVSPPISHYDHRSHTPLSHTHRSHTYRSLTHRALTHRDLTHCSHTMTTSSAVSRRNGTKALPPARLPGARIMEPTLSQGAPW